MGESTIGISGKRRLDCAGSRVAVMNVATHEIAAVSAHLNEVYPMLPFTPVRGVGVYLENAAGRRILDFYGGHAVAALGYGHRDLSEAIARTSRDLVFQTNALPLKVRDEAAEKLAAFGPPGLGRVFFVNSGAEANENALRLAFKVTGRSKVVAMEHSFHGRTAAAAAVTYGAMKSWYGFPRAPFDVAFVPRNDAAALDAAVDSSTAAVIVEPVQGLAGAFDFAPQFLHAIRAACDRSGALMIIDEVQTGMGRLGAPFGAQLYDVTLDFTIAGCQYNDTYSVAMALDLPSDAGTGGSGGMTSTDFSTDGATVEFTIDETNVGGCISISPAGVRGFQWGLVLAGFGIVMWARRRRTHAK
jgi:acetylornithine/succinyldiaminopimelate/putrescine aminotransferase